MWNATDEEVRNLVARVIRFGPGRATNHTIELICETAGPEVGIRVPGGVASIEDRISLMRSGATVAAFCCHLADQLKGFDRKP